jgi:hypothetical protein
MGPVPFYSANGIRTRVWALRGPRPSPLDDSAVVNESRVESRESRKLLRARADSTTRSSTRFLFRFSSIRDSRLVTRGFSQQARQDSNLQPPVLETGALPLELRTFEGG